MGFFDKKDKTNTSSQSKGKGKKDTMASILNESVLETAIEEFKQNSVFIYNSPEKGPLYVSMLLDVNHSSFGGLNKKTKKDEAKGNIITQISSGTMKAYISPALMEEEKIAFIPDAPTLSLMSEFSILTDATYTLGFVDNNGYVEDTGFEITYAMVSDVVVSKNTSLIDFLVQAGVSSAVEENRYKSDDELEEEDRQQQEELSANVSQYIDDEGDAPFDDSNDDFDTSDFNDADAMDDSVDFYDDDTYSDEDVYTDNNEFESDEEETQASFDDGIEVDATIFDEVITRRFYSDDLGLEVTTEAFDAQFLHHNTYLPFEENRGDGWLNHYLNQMCKEANTELRHMHKEHLFRMRELYYELVSAHCTKIIVDLDKNKLINDDGSENPVARMVSDAETKKENALSNLQRDVAERKDALKKSFEESLIKVGEEGRAAAQQAYRQRYEPSHKDELLQIEPRLKASIQSAYEDEMRDINEYRKEEASKLLDIGIQEALVEVSERYKDLVTIENERYNRWRDLITQFLEENRKDDLSYMAVLKEELAQSDRADKVMAERTEYINSLRRSYEEKHQALVNEMERNASKSNAELHNMRSEYEQKLMDMKDDGFKVREELRLMTEKFTQLDTNKAKEYESRLRQMADEREAWERKCDHLMSLNKRSGTMIGLLSLVGAVAALAIGVIIGTSMNLSRKASDTSSKMESELADRLDRMESEMRETQPVQTQPVATQPTYYETQPESYYRPSEVTTEYATEYESGYSQWEDTTSSND